MERVIAALELQSNQMAQQGIAFMKSSGTPDMAHSLLQATNPALKNCAGPQEQSCTDTAGAQRFLTQF